MRLWHKDLICVLPRQQLLGQWRECCAIAKNIAEKGSPNHLLVNKIMNYPPQHFYKYAVLVVEEMNARGYKCDFSKFRDNYKKIVEKLNFPYAEIEYRDLFCNWHTTRYLAQCYYNLQEKYDCGGIANEEWQNLKNKAEFLIFNKVEMNEGEYYG